jgi:hypothetical protein
MTGARRRLPRRGVRSHARRHSPPPPRGLVVGVGNPMAVPRMARLGARRGEIRRVRYADRQLSGSLSTEGFSKYYVYTNVKTSRSASPICLFEA